MDHRYILSNKLSALCNEYGVKPKEVDRELILVLARRYVPGFQIDKGTVRRHKKWDDLRLAQLWVVFRSARSTAASDKSAVVKLVQRSDVQGIAGNVKVIWILQLLTRAKLSPLVQMMESPRSS
jgi:hypothetical protein